LDHPKRRQYPQKIIAPGEKHKSADVECENL